MVSGEDFECLSGPVAYSLIIVFQPLAQKRQRPTLSQLWRLPETTERLSSGRLDERISVLECPQQCRRRTGIDTYQGERPQSALGYLTPAKYRERLAA